MMSPNPPRPGTGPGASAPADVTPAAQPPRWLSHTLLEGHTAVEIVHGDQVYRLRLTALGKLILTK